MSRWSVSLGRASRPSETSPGAYRAAHGRIPLTHRRAIVMLARTLRPKRIAQIFNVHPSTVYRLRSKDRNAGA